MTSNRVLKLAWFLNKGAVWEVEYEICVRMGFDTPHDAPKNTFCTPLTYSDRERIDITKALNWLYEFSESGPIALFSDWYRLTIRDTWHNIYLRYLTDWDYKHQDEVDAWNNEPEQVLRNGILDAFEAMEQNDKGPKETIYDKLRAYQPAPAKGGFLVPPQFAQQINYRCAMAGITVMLNTEGMWDDNCYDKVAADMVEHLRLVPKT
jgi:hypothetical protein